MRYDARPVYLDHRGAIAQKFLEFADDTMSVDVPDDNEVRLIDAEGSDRMRLGHSVAWLHAVADPGESVEEEDITAISAQLWHLVQEHIEPPSLTRYGMRSISVLVFKDVEEAVSAFRRRFFDYREDASLCLGGEPKEVQAMLRAEGVGQSENGTSLAAALRVTPIHILPTMLEDLALDEGEYGGGWALDLDVYAAPVEAADVEVVLSGLYRTSRGILEDVWRQMGKADDVASA